MYLAVDIGNTRIKAGLFTGNDLVAKHVFEDEASFLDWASKQPVTKAIVSSVGQDLGAELPFPTLQFGSNELHLPIKVDYRTPHTLGKDRLAAAIGAYSLFPKADCLVIDAGTCITYELVAKGSYLGGAISPGLQMRFKALNQFTARLPLVEDTNDFVELTGKDTVQCIRSGVVNGLLFEIQGVVEEYKNRHRHLHVIMTGGDAPFFESIIKGDIFAFPDLVLHGLHHTLVYNAPL
jgi:type III pantothenate kinase